MTMIADDVGGRQLGLLTSSSEPILIDAVARARMDFLWLDAEYTGLSPVQAVHTMRQLGGQGISVLVRVPSVDVDTLVTFANTGIDEIVLPRVRTLDQIERACSCLAYPPHGQRPRQVVPATAWGDRYDHAPQVSMIIETVDAVRALPRLLDSGLLSSYWIGHKDLSDDYAREFGGAAGLEDLISGVIETLRQAGVRFGWGVPEPCEAESVWTAGGTRCALYWDLHLFRHLARSVGIARPERGASPSSAR